MPTYAYRCKSCSYEFEELQKFSDPPLTECPSCRKNTLARMLSGGVGFVFKGSGFYSTDYKKSGSADSEKGKGKTEKTGTADGKKTPKTPSTPPPSKSSPPEKS